MSNSIVDELLLRLIRQEQVQKLQDISKTTVLKSTGVQKLFVDIRYESLFICEAYSEAEQAVITEKINKLNLKISQSSVILDDENRHLISLIQDKIGNGYRLTKELMIYLNKLYTHFKKRH